MKQYGSKVYWKTSLLIAATFTWGTVNVFAEEHPESSSDREPASQSPLNQTASAAQNDMKKWGATVGLQFPAGLVLEANYYHNRDFSFALTGGGFSLSAGIANPGYSGQSFGVLAFDARARYHPGKGAFFLGVSLGWLQYWANTINNNPNATATLSGLSITPHLGWHWVFSNGITVGTELGAQIPLSARTFNYTDLAQSEIDLGNRLSALIVPYLTLIKLGYSF